MAELAGSEKARRAGRGGAGRGRAGGRGARPLTEADSGEGWGRSGGDLNPEGAGATG